MHATVNCDVVTKFTGIKIWNHSDSWVAVFP